MEIKNVSFSQNASFKGIPSLKPHNITVEYTDKDGMPIVPASIAEAMRYYTEYAIAGAKEKGDKVRVTFYDKNGKSVKPKSIDQGFDYILQRKDLTPVHTHLLTSKQTEHEIPTEPTEPTNVPFEPDEQIIPTEPTEPTNVPFEPDEQIIPTEPTEPTNGPEPTEVFELIEPKVQNEPTVNNYKLNGENKDSVELSPKKVKAKREEAARRLIASLLLFTQLTFFQKGVRVSIEELLQKANGHFNREPRIVQTYNDEDEVIYEPTVPLDVDCPTEPTILQLNDDDCTEPTEPAILTEPVTLDLTGPFTFEFYNKENSTPVEPTSFEQAVEFIQDYNTYSMDISDCNGNGIAPTSLDQVIEFLTHSNIEPNDSVTSKTIIAESEIPYSVGDTEMVTEDPV